MQLIACIDNYVFRLAIPASLSHALSSPIGLVLHIQKPAPTVSQTNPKGFLIHIYTSFLFYPSLFHFFHFLDQIHIYISTLMNFNFYFLYKQLFHLSHNLR